MTRNLKGSLLIASMLVVLWTTSSQACHFLRRACQPTSCYSQSGCTYGSPTGYYSSGQGGYVTGGGYYGGGYSGGTAGYPGGYGQVRPARTGTTSAGPATTRAASAGRRPGWGCGPAWASAASGRGADRPQVHRSPCWGVPVWTNGLTRAVSAAVN